MAVTDEEFLALSVEVQRLSARVRTLEDDRAVDRAEAEIRHRAVMDSLHALRETQVEHGRDLASLREDFGRMREHVDSRFGTLTQTLSHVVHLLEGDQP